MKKIINSRGIFFIYFFLVCFALSASENWENDATKAAHYYSKKDYDVAWLFYERALKRGCDDGETIWKAAQTFQQQTLVIDPEFGVNLYSVAYYFLSKEDPPHALLEEAKKMVEPGRLVNQRFLRKTYATLGVKAPRAPLSLSSRFPLILNSLVLRVEDFIHLFTLLKMEGFHETFTWAWDRALRLIISLIILSALTGIILPLVMAIVIAKEGRKSYVSAYALFFHWGFLGIHRFYLGRHISGIIWLLTGGLLGLGLFFDFFLTGAYVRFWNEDHRENPLRANSSVPRKKVSNPLGKKKSLVKSTVSHKKTTKKKETRRTTPPSRTPRHPDPHETAALVQEKPSEALTSKEFEIDLPDTFDHEQFSMDLNSNDPEQASDPKNDEDEFDINSL